MTPDILLALATIFSSIAGSWLMSRAQMSRTPIQNAKETMDTAHIALEISEQATQKYRDVIREVDELKEILKNQRYKITIFFSIGENPMVESASVEAMHHTPNTPKPVE